MSRDSKAEARVRGTHAGRSLHLFRFWVQCFPWAHGLWICQMFGWAHCNDSALTSKIQTSLASKLAIVSTGACLFARWQIILAACMYTKSYLDTIAKKEKVRATLLRIWRNG